MLKVKVEINVEEREKNNEVLKVKVEINLEEYVWKWKEANVLARGPSCLKHGELQPVVVVHSVLSDHCDIT